MGAKHFKLVELILPLSEVERIEKRAKALGLETGAEYIEELVHEDASMLTQEELEDKLLEALESGESSPIDEAFWERLENGALSRADEIRQAKLERNRRYAADQ